MLKEQMSIEYQKDYSKDEDEDEDEWKKTQGQTTKLRQM
jgi:hypothetical protein